MAAVETRTTRLAMRVASWLVLAFLYVPLVVIFLYAFNSSIGQAWPLLPAKNVIRPIIDSTFPLTDARLAHERMESGKHIGKIVLVVR